MLFLFLVNCIHQRQKCSISLRFSCFGWEKEVNKINKTPVVQAWRLVSDQLTIIVHSKNVYSPAAWWKPPGDCFGCRLLMVNYSSSCCKIVKCWISALSRFFRLLNSDTAGKRVKISCLILGEKFWQVFHGHKPHSQLWCLNCGGINHTTTSAGNWKNKKYSKNPA